ncbi:hypothetical protein [Roseomonas elaeocarpi]|uniref:Uncharacterized protein n=1 Tax=Roseomonas elaeocarpi TaxID=907779 RepID=A0ABV6JYW3_9PROT
MPFDGTNFPPRPNEPRPVSRQERFFVAVAIVVTLLMMLMPISPAGVAGLIHYFWG